MACNARAVLIATRDQDLINTVAAAWAEQRDKLIDGQGLLALLKQYTGQQMKIEFTRSQPRRSSSH